MSIIFVLDLLSEKHHADGFIGLGDKPLYQHKTILLATKHEKEKVIGPILNKHLQAKLFIPDDYDTDQFGTFSGEIERQFSPLKTCIEKAKKAADIYGFSYALASEGSFGPHPQLPFVPCNTEILVFLDRVHNYVITEHMITDKTNFAYLDVNKDEPYQHFLQQIQFPSHAVILKEQPQMRILAKGVNHIEELESIVKAHFHKNPNQTLRIETDMRAMMNPTRMMAIQQATEKLMIKLKSLCPKCKAPGFGQTKVSGNLLCEWCHSPTSAYLNTVKTCIACDYQMTCPREDGRLYADPGHCAQCNP